MKIGLVLDDTLDTPDGVQQYVLTVGGWLSAQGHSVRYLVGHTTRTDLSGVHSLSRNVQVRFNGNRMSMPLPASRTRLRRFLETERFDVLHVQVPYSPFLAGRLLQVVPSDTAVVGTFHILPYSRLVTAANRLLGYINYRSGRRFDRMLAVSAPAAAFAKRQYGYDCQVVPNPIRLDRFLGAKNKNEATTIVFLGRLVERKGPLLLLQALAYIRRHDLYDGDFRCIFGGKGELRPALERYATEQHLMDIVRFEGFVDENKKPTFLAQGDVVAYPSTGGESFGIVLLEAMAAARGIVLAGNNPGYASVMAPFPGQLLDPQDIPGFAQVLADCLRDATRRTLAAGEQKHYVRRFDIGVVGQQLENCYHEALHKRSQT